MSLPVSITRGNTKTIQSLHAPRFFIFLCIAHGFNVTLLLVSLSISVSELGILVLGVPLKVMLPDDSEIRFNKM